MPSSFDSYTRVFSSFIHLLRSPFPTESPSTSPDDLSADFVVRLYAQSPRWSQLQNFILSVFGVEFLPTEVRANLTASLQFLSDSHRAVPSASPPPVSIYVVHTSAAQLIGAEKPSFGLAVALLFAFFTRASEICFFFCVRGGLPEDPLLSSCGKSRGELTI